eukprot:jgi/Mesvir1/11615/Mv00021-RA.2
MAFYNLPAVPSVQMLAEFRQRVESEVGRTAMMDLLGMEIISLMAWCPCPAEGDRDARNSNDARNVTGAGGGIGATTPTGSNGIDTRSATGNVGEGGLNGRGGVGGEHASKVDGVYRVEREPFADASSGALRRGEAPGAVSRPIMSRDPPLGSCGECEATAANGVAFAPSASLPMSVGKALRGGGLDERGAANELGDSVNGNHGGGRRQHNGLDGNDTMIPPARTLPAPLLDTAAVVALAARRAAAAVERWWWLEEATRMVHPEDESLWGSPSAGGDEGDEEQQQRQRQLYQSIQLSRTAFRVAEKYVDQARDVLSQGTWQGQPASYARAGGKLGVEDRPEGQGERASAAPFFLPVLVPGGAAAMEARKDGAKCGPLGPRSGDAHEADRSPMEKLLFQPPPVRCFPEDSLVVGTLDITVGSSLPGAGLVGRYPESVAGEENNMGGGWQQPQSPFMVARGGHDRRRAYIFNVCVAPLFRRQGVGTQLMAHARQVAASLGVTVLYVHAEAANTGAVELYRRAGFELEAEETEATAQRLGRERRVLLRCFLDDSHRKS